MFTKGLGHNMIKINLIDFWYPRFDPSNNFFVHLFREVFGEIEIRPVDECDVVIYSCYGDSHHRVDRSRTKKIFYTGENKRPNHDECDHSLTFDFDTYGGKNTRLPLWMLQIDWFGHRGYGNPDYVIPMDGLVENQFTKKKKSKFCGFVFNNPVPLRTRALETFNTYKQVDGFGRPFGNWFYGEEMKYNILSDYKFSICFENSIHDGYYTEKLLHAKLAGTIPIYWTDKNVGRDFNVKGFINLANFKDMNELLECVKLIDKDNDLYEQMRNEPLFSELPTLDKLKHELIEIIG